MSTKKKCPRLDVELKLYFDVDSDLYDSTATNTRELKIKFSKAALDDNTETIFREIVAKTIELETLLTRYQTVLE